MVCLQSDHMFVVVNIYSSTLTSPHQQYTKMEGCALVFIFILKLYLHIHDNHISKCTVVSNSIWWVAGLEPDKVNCLNCVGGQY